MSNYRHDDKPPVPLHCLCDGMAVSMHRELRAVYEVLMFVCRGTDCDLSYIENLIDGKIDSAKEQA